MSKEINILPLEAMALRLTQDFLSKETCLEIRYGSCRGFYQSMLVRAEDIPSGGGLLFSDIAKLAARKEEERLAAQEAVAVKES